MKRKRVRGIDRVTERARDNGEEKRERGRERKKTLLSVKIEREQSHLIHETKVRKSRERGRRVRGVK